jgi:ankyrin repeat protein
MDPDGAASPSVSQQRCIASQKAWENLTDAMHNNKPQAEVSTLLGECKQYMMDTSLLVQTTKDGKNMLHLAARSAYHDVLSTVCKMHSENGNPTLIDATTQDAERTTALHLAAHAGNLPEVKTLLKCSANPYALTTTKITPLLMALFGYNQCSDAHQHIELKKQYRTVIQLIVKYHTSKINLQEFSIPLALERLFDGHAIVAEASLK